MEIINSYVGATNTWTHKGIISDDELLWDVPGRYKTFLKNLKPVN